MFPNSAKNKQSGKCPFPIEETDTSLVTVPGKHQTLDSFLQHDPLKLAILDKFRVSFDKYAFMYKIHEPTWHDYKSLLYRTSIFLLYPPTPLSSSCFLRHCPWISHQLPLWVPLFDNLVKVSDHLTDLQKMFNAWKSVIEVKGTASERRPNQVCEEFVC